MHKPTTGIASEGFVLVGLLALATLTFALLGVVWASLLFLVLLCLTVFFFRDPERAVTAGENLAVSPADGKIARIAEREDPFGKGTRTCISVFMNVFNVHVNRSPVAGTLTGLLYVPGAFFNASRDRASRDNERCAWQLRDEQGLIWSFVQVAGLAARRISPRAEVGDALARGERFGMIRLGSRVDLYLPAEYAATVEIGDSVWAGQTVIARLAATGVSGAEISGEEAPAAEAPVAETPKAGTSRGKAAKAEASATDVSGAEAGTPEG
jgi:phosphatidylserine decarboxylase